MTAAYCITVCASCVIILPCCIAHPNDARSCELLKMFGGSNHITGTTEPTVVKFCTQVSYINSSNRMTYHPQKGRGYGHVTVLKFSRLP